MTRRPVFSRSALPTRPMGLRDMLLWWLVAEKIGIDLWLTAAIGALMFLRFVGELASLGQEDQCLALVARSKDEANSQNSDQNAG